MKKQLTRKQRDDFFKIYYNDALPITKTAKDAYYFAENVFKSIYGRRAYGSLESWSVTKSKMLQERTYHEIMNSNYDYIDITEEKTIENIKKQAEQIKKVCRDHGIEF